MMFLRNQGKGLQPEFQVESRQDRPDLPQHEGTSGTATGGGDQDYHKDEENRFAADLADQLGVSRQSLSNHLTCLRGCGLVVAMPEGRRVRYELADDRLRHALTDLLGVVLAVDEQYCRDAVAQPAGSR